MKPTIADDDLREDPLDDQVSALLKEMRKCKKLTREWVAIKTKVIACMTSGNGIEFTSDNRLYRLTQVGQTLVCQVPTDKKGYLKNLRGECIRLVCVGSLDRSRRTYVAAKLNRQSLRSKKS